LEDWVLSQFEYHQPFFLKGTKYLVDRAAKPRPSAGGGECKTDVFVEGSSQSGKTVQLKISVKTRSTSEFQQNKVSAVIAEAYFGPNWSTIIREAILSIEDAFRKQELIDANGRYPTRPNSIKLGWKLEIANKPRALSVKVPLSEQEIRDFVYKGTNQPTEKQDALVNDEIIIKSGIAEYLLVTEIEEINSTDDVINQLVLIDEADIGDTYLIFTANNYRTDVDKTDGPRPLAVQIEWLVDSGELGAILILDEPLEKTGEGDMKGPLVSALKDLDIYVPCKLPGNITYHYLDLKGKKI